MNYKEQYRLLMKQQKQEQSWSARQAKKQMEFQRMMSSTAHQREVKDLQAAGLNPVLSAGGNGASTGSGAMAEQSSIIPELAELLRAAGSGHGGGTKVVIKEEEPEKPSQYFTARQFKQGIHAGQGAFHGIANSGKAAKTVERIVEERKQELRDAFKDVGFNVGVRGIAGKIIPTANARFKGEDAEKVRVAYNKLLEAQALEGRMNINRNARETEKFIENVKESLKRYWRNYSNYITKGHGY